MIDALKNAADLSDITGWVGVLGNKVKGLGGD